MKITSNNVWINEAFTCATLTIEKGIIKTIAYKKEEEALDYGDLYIIPGMIETHTHGHGGGCVIDGEEEVFRKWARELPQEGVTTWLPGLITAEEDVMCASLKAIKTVKDENIKGAFIHGVHFQAIFHDHNYAGIYDKFLLRKPTVERMKHYNEVCGGIIKTVAIPSEHDENHETIKYCVENNIKVSLGFSGASYEESLKAIEDGASNVVHCFNCMIGMHHRSPNLPVAAMVDDRVFSEVMADGVHVHPAIITLVGKMKGKDRLITVTDSSYVKGLGVGIHHLPERDIEIKEDGSVIWCENGKLGGSIITMIKNVENLQKLGKLDLVTAINAATINPARFLGIDDYKGLIKENYQADLAIYNDKYEIVQTYVNGETML